MHFGAPWSPKTDVFMVAASATILIVGSCVRTSVFAVGPTLCPIRVALGIPCPGCGITRGISAFLHGDIADSLAFNPMSPLVVLLAASVIANYIEREIVDPLRVDRRRGDTKGPSTILITAAITAGIGWVAALTTA